MNRFLAVAIVSYVATTTFALAAEPRRPNVVFILADDLGWSDIEPYGSRFHETPNLGRLAKRSAKFMNYYAASPLCSPTRSSVLTGLYPVRTGITAPACHLPKVQLEKILGPAGPNQPVRIANSVTRMKSEYVTLAEVFKENGYATVHFGKWHLGHGPGYEPKDQGFDVDIPHTPRTPGPSGGYFAPWRFVTNPQFKGKPGQHIDAWLADEAGMFVREHKDEPFFMSFWTYSVHSPWNARKEDIEYFEAKVDRGSPQRNPLYAAMVKGLDDSVGRLLDALDDAGVTENTIIIFTSDNGGWAYRPRATEPPGYDTVPATSNAPLRSGKASNYEGGTREPCLVSWPGHIEPGERHALFSSVDWFPTLMNMTGVIPDQAVETDGVDQTPAIQRDESVREAVYCHFPHGGPAQEVEIPGFWPATWVCQGDWKLIRFYAKNDDRTDRLELFNLATDIGETTNVATEQNAVTSELSNLMDTFLRETDAVIPMANPRFRAGGAEATGKVKRVRRRRAAGKSD